MTKRDGTQEILENIDAIIKGGAEGHLPRPTDGDETDSWIDVSSDTWEPALGEKLTGVLESRETVATQHGPRDIYTIRRKTGPAIRVYGSTMLKRQLGPLGDGCRVMIRYDGKTDKGMKLFIVKVHPDDINTPPAPKARPERA